MRPDEIASLSEIERSKSRDKFAKGAIGTGASLVGATMAARVVPFLSEFIPQNIAIKGISKLSPKLGNALKRGASSGLNIEDGLNFIKENLFSNEENAKVNKSKDFQSKYPQVIDAIAKLMNQGQTPEAAAGILKTHSVYGKLVKQIEKEEKMDFLDLINDLMSSNQAQTQQMPQQKQMTQPEQMQVGQQGGGIDQEIMAALDKILKM